MSYRSHAFPMELTAGQCFRCNGHKYEVRT